MSKERFTIRPVFGEGPKGPANMVADKLKQSQNRGIMVLDTGIIGRFIRKPIKVTQEGSFCSEHYFWGAIGLDPRPLFLGSHTYGRLQEDGSFMLMNWTEAVDDPGFIVDSSKLFIPSETLRKGYKIPETNLKVVGRG